MTDVTFTFNQSVNDIVQLDAYLDTNLSSDFKYLVYIPSTTTLKITVDDSILEADLSSLLSGYTNPVFVSNNGIYNSSGIYTSNLYAFTGNSNINVNTNLTVSGVATVTNTTVSSSTSTGSVIVSGGVGVAGKLYVGGGISANNTIISSVATPIVNTDVATKGYVDLISVGSISAGNGLGESSGTFSVNVDGSSIEINSDTLRVASGIAGTGLSGGSGVSLSVNASQTQITQVGTLSSLTSSGTINFTNTVTSTTSTTGSLLVSGGIGIANTTDSVSSTNGGSITTAGGVSIAKKLFVGTIYRYLVLLLLIP